MKRPSFQFYPGDWSANPNLRRCTFAEKGIWLEVLGLMHDQVEYGVLRWPLKEIAEAVKCRAADLQALARKEVLKGSDKQFDRPFVYVPRHARKDGEPVMLIAAQPGPIWFSSRMVKDEYLRTTKGESTRFGADSGDESGEAPKRSPSQRQGDGSSSSSSSSSSLKTKPQESSSGGNSAASVEKQTAAAQAKPDPIHVRACEITALLRQRGAGVTASDPRVRAWASNAAATDAALLGALQSAQDARSKAKDPTAINAGYLDTILGNVLSGKITYDLEALSKL